jgi:hypothetical protein
MAACNSRVAITTDMWTSDNQKKGYMVITSHFIDDGWKFRNVVMRYTLILLLMARSLLEYDIYCCFVIYACWSMIYTTVFVIYVVVFVIYACWSTIYTVVL